MKAKREGGWSQGVLGAQWLGVAGGSVCAVEGTQRAWAVHTLRIPNTGLAHDGSWEGRSKSLECPTRQSVFKVRP